MRKMSQRMSSWWQIGQKYAILAGALLVAYGRGRKSVRREVERRVLGRDLEHRGLGKVLRGDAVSVDAGDRLRA